MNKKQIAIMTLLYLLSCWAMPCVFIGEYVNEVVGAHIGFTGCAFAGYLMAKALKK